MIFDLPFDVVFCPDYESEVVIDEWTRGEAAGYTYYEARLEELCFSILEHAGGNIYLKVFNPGEKLYTGFVGVRYSWKHENGCYTLIPAIYYDGNNYGETEDIPKISLPKRPVFSAPVSAASYPTVIVKDGDRGYSYTFSPTSFAGWNGIELDVTKESLTIFAPAREKNIYLGDRYTDYGRPPFTWRQFSVVSLRFSRQEFDCPTVSEVFDQHWNDAIRDPLYPAVNTPKITEEHAAEIVRDWMYDMHMLYNEQGEPLILNAFMDEHTRFPNSLCAEWVTQIGWCCGTMTALPMLKFGGKYREFALKFFDFISQNGNSPSGVKYSVYDGKRWMTKDHPEASNREYNHVRFYSDHLYYLGQAIRFERENGNEHPIWVEEFRRGADILVDLWERERDFGIHWDIDGEKVQIKRGGTAAGAYCLLVLGEAVSHYPDDERLQRAFDEATLEYYNRCVCSGHCNGGPGDAMEADDSESCAALATALVTRYKLLGGETNLKMATDAAKLFATWVVNYQPSFPGGTMFEGINVCGGVIANVQNRHIGPGICTNSARFLYDLGRFTKDSRWCDLYYNVKAAAINCVTSYDGEFFGLTFNTPFMKGMLSEQINIADVLNSPGETWRVSACWPATSVLLGWFDTPNE